MKRNNRTHISNFKKVILKSEQQPKRPYPFFRRTTKEELESRRCKAYEYIL